MKSYSVIAKKLGSVLASISSDKIIQKTLNDFYISAPLEITGRLAADWFEHLDKMSENPDNLIRCIELSRLLKKSSISYFPLFFTQFHEMNKVISTTRYKMEIFKEFLISRYEIETQEEFDMFVDLVVKEMCYLMVARNHYRKITEDRTHFIGIPVENTDGFEEFFYNSDVDELDRNVPVYYDKGYLGTIEEFIQLPDEELKKHKLGTCYGFVLTTTFGSDEFIASKFKPNWKCLSYQHLKDYYDEDIKPSKSMRYKPKHYAKLIPVFETVDRDKFLKMLVFKTVN